MIIKLNEAYSKTMPDWIKSELDLVPGHETLASRYDFANAEFHEGPVPTSNRDKSIKDPNKVHFFLLDFPTTARKYTKGGTKYIDYKLAIYHDGYWTSPFEFKDFGLDTWRDIVAHTVKYAWIDANSGEGADKLRKARAELRAGALALERSMNSWSADRDKSGYIVDKDKYRRILSTKKLDKYISDLDEVNNIISNVKQAISDYVNSLKDPYKIDKLAHSYYNREYKYTSSTGAVYDLGKLLNIASKLNKAILNVQSGSPASEYRYMLDELDKAVSDATRIGDSIIKELSI